LSISTAPSSSNIIVSVQLDNTSSKPGAETIQVYVSAVSPSIHRPLKELKGFCKTFLKPGEGLRVEVVLDHRCATSFWDEKKNAWKSEKGSYKVLVGNSSDCEFLIDSFDVETTRWWTGL